MTKNRILIVIFLLVIAYAIYYFLNHSEDGMKLMGGEGNGLGRCYSVSSESPFNQDTIPWGMGISFSMATTGVFNQEMDHTYDTAVMSFLKGINVQPNLRTIAIYAEDIKAYMNSPLGNIDAWDIRVGEFLCQ